MSTLKPRNPRRSNEQFVVAKRGIALFNNGVNTHINNSSTRAVVLADGQLGVFATSGNKAHKSAAVSGTVDTALTMPSIAIYQGTESSSNPGNLNYSAPLWNRPYERTQDIDARNWVLGTKQLFERGANSVWTLKNVTAQSLTTYGLSVQFRGRWAEEFFGNQQAANLGIQMTTPAYSAAQLLTTVPVSEIIHRLAYDINRNSSNLSMSQSRGGNWPIVGFAIDTAAGAGVALSALAVGTPVSIVTTANGPIQINLTQDQIDSLQAAATAASIALTATVVPVDLSALTTVNALLIMTLDRTPAIKDYDPTTKISMRVGLSYGFNYLATYLKEGSFAKEPQNGGRQLANMYKFTEGQRKYDLMSVEDPIVEFPNPIDPTETYNLLTIEHEYVEQIDHSHTSHSPMLEYILIPTTVKGVPDVGAGAFANLVTYLDSWLTSANKLTIQSI
jgi:hypothetical protein